MTGFDDDHVDGPGQMKRVEALSKLMSNAKPTMTPDDCGKCGLPMSQHGDEDWQVTHKLTPAEISALTNAEVAERIAVDVEGRERADVVGRRCPDGRWWWDGHFRVGSVPSYSPATTPAQAMALARERLTDCFLRWLDGAVFIYRNVIERRHEHHDFVCAVKWADNEHADLRAICEAVLIAHYGKGKT